MGKQPVVPEYKITVLVVDDDFETRENVTRALTFESIFEVVGTANNGREAIALAQSLAPDIVLMDINMPDMDGLVATARISKESPSAQIIIMSMQNENSYIQRAMVAGARSYLSKPIAIDELYATIRDVYERTRRTVYQSAEPEETEARRGPEAHIVMVYSPQAGAGATTVATNVAASLMREDTSVLLVDCNLYFGDVGVFLNAQVRQSIADLAGIADDVDQEIINNVLVTHDSGLKILLAPAMPQDAAAITASQVIALVQRLRNSFDFIVIDTATHLDDLNLALFDLASQILLIGTPTLAAIKNVRNILDLLDARDVHPDKVQVLLNRVSAELEKAKITLAVQAIEHNLRRKVFASIPMDERRVLSAVNRGIAVVAKDRKQSPAKELIALSDALRESLLGATENITQSLPGG